MRIAGYHRLSIESLVNFHGRRMGLGERLKYITPDVEVESGRPAAWYIDGDYDHRPVRQTITRNNNQTYRLQRRYHQWVCPAMAGVSISW